jgi:hypothetical protein
MAVSRRAAMIASSQATRSSMTRFALLLLALAASRALAWGADGHSIVAELAQRRLTPAARFEVERLLGPGVSLASVASWADDVRPARPETFNWHFVDIPVRHDGYDATVHCTPTPGGDCIVAALERERAILACRAGDGARRDALRFAVHFVADLHQPMHTVDEEQGANGIKVDVEIRAGKCPKCSPRRTQDNLHAVWDTTLITQTAWNWGAYVTRLEVGWLASPEARGADAGTPVDWVLATHRAAARAWDWLPDGRLIGDDYYARAIPVIDQQLSLAGIRLARFLNESLVTSPDACP